MALTLAAAALGSALIGGATALSAAHQQKKAADKANDAQQEASAAQLAAQQANLDRIAGLQQPYVSAGYAGLDAIMRRYGLSAPAGTAGTSPPAAPANGLA